MPNPSWNRALIALALCAVPAVTQAQTRYSVGVSGLYARPLGEFAENVRQGWGADGFGAIGLDRQGIFSLRGELGYVRHGRKSERFLVNTGFGYIDLESETTSGVLTLGAGPHIMAPAGPLRPYIGGTVGFARFATNTSINVPAEYSNTGQKETIEEQNVKSDFILSWAGSAGVAFQLNFLGRGILGDFGVRYHRNGEAEYVSDVTYNGSGSPTITATRSETDFLVYRLGIVIPLGGGGRVTVSP